VIERYLSFYGFGFATWLGLLGFTSKLMHPSIHFKKKLIFGKLMDEGVEISYRCSFSFKKLVGVKIMQLQEI